MKLYRAFATVGGLTLISRIMGFFRDIAFAALVGAGPVAEAFVVAFRLPNLFRRWFGEGALNSAFVPLFAKRFEENGRDAARNFASEVLSVLALALLILTAIAMLAMPMLMYVLAPGFVQTAGKFDLAVAMSRIAFPYILCMSLVALLSGALNSLGKFVESSAVSIVLNLSLMAAMGFAWLMGHQNDATCGLILAVGILIAGFLQLALLIYGAWRHGMLPRLGVPRLTPDVRRLVTLGVPGVIAGGITQINIVIGSMVASLQNGAVSWLFYADRLYELPLAMVGIAIGVVLLPDISRHLRAGNQEAVLDAQNRSLEFAMLLTVPAAVALAVIPHEIIRILFERGAFTANDTANVAGALALFALGLPSFVAIKVFSPAFFAREDTKTPMRFAAISLGLNTLGSIALFFLFGAMGYSPHLGIALATSLGGWVNAILLYRALRQHRYFVADRRLKRSLPMILLSSAVLGLALVAGAHWLSPWLVLSGSLAVRASALAALTIGGAALYFALAALTGGFQPGGFMRALRRS